MVCVGKLVLVPAIPEMYNACRDLGRLSNPTAHVVMKEVLEPGSRPP